MFVFFFVFFNPKKSSHRQTDMARLLVLVNSVVLLLFGSDVFLVGASKYESKSISQSTVRFCSPVKKRFCAPWRCVYGHPFVHSLTVLWITLLACAKVIRGLIDYSVERKESPKCFDDAFIVSVVFQLLKLNICWFSF